MAQAASAQVLRAHEAAKGGTPTVTLRRSVLRGQLQRLDRGVYAPAELSEPRIDLVVATARMPQSVVCLLTALRFHELTTINPPEVWLAVPRGAWHPKRLSVPVHQVTMAADLVELGAESHTLAGRTVRVHGLARTIVDCFKFRNTVGLDIAIVALKDAIAGRRVTVDDLMRYADRLRMARVMRPYLESIA